jgi:hypothetical protein
VKKRENKDVIKYEKMAFQVLPEHKAFFKKVDYGIQSAVIRNLIDESMKFIENHEDGLKYLQAGLVEFKLLYHVASLEVSN